jgi:penicillin-binding protein 1B
MRRFATVSLVLTAGAILGAAVVGGYRLYRWDRDVSESFRSHQWRFPSKIFADSTLLYPGIEARAVGLLQRLHRLGYRPTKAEVPHEGEYRQHAAGIDLTLHESIGADPETAGHVVRLDIANNVIVRIDDLTAQRELFACELEPELIGGLYKGVWEERRLVTLAELPPLLIQAIIDVEDRDFYSHHGIDSVGILRALWVNLRSGHVVQGGSTLTQQLMKNFFLTDERTLRRKIREAAMALIVESRFSKDEILEKYVNEIYLGQRGAQGVFGVWEASRFYFSKIPRELSPGEIALLAGLIRAPNAYSPFRDPERARRRRDEVLLIMHKQGDLTDDQLRDALLEPIRTTPTATATKEAPYFLDFVRQELEQAYPTDLLTSEGLAIFTALDTHLQALAEQAVRDGLHDLEEHHPNLRGDEASGQLQACLIVVQPQTGAIKAMMGGRDYRASQFNRCTQALRQPGSVFKPFTYLAAFETTRDEKRPIRPTTRLEDRPFEWRFDSQVWSPSNYRNRYHGEVTVRRALEQSLNAATARLAYQIGLPPIIDMAHRMGITSPLPQFPALVLGAVEVTPMEVAQAFAVLANGGLRSTLLSVRKVLNRAGQAVERRPVEVQQAVPADTAFLVTYLLEGVMDSGTGRDARRAGFTRPAAGKTGTTNDYRDAWFAGFTPDLLAVVWVGFDQIRSLNLSGAEAALPVWTRFMQAATAGRPATAFVPPPSVAIVDIDPASGGAATAACPTRRPEAFYATDVPGPCPLHAPPLEAGPQTEGTVSASPVAGETAPDPSTLPEAPAPQ